jgi:hypothetical protein
LARRYPSDDHSLIPWAVNPVHTDRCFP